MQKLQTQGLHHITLVGADRQTSIDFWEGLLGMPFVFEQPNLDNAEREPHLFRSRRRAADHRLHPRGPQARSAPHADRPRLRPSHRLQRLARRVHAGGRAARRARHQAHRRARPQDLRRDLFRGPARAADRAFLLQVRAAGRLQPFRRAVRGAQAARRGGRPRDRRSPSRRRDREPRRTLATEPVRPTARPKDPYRR